MEAPRPPITDSPWFWVLVFSLMAMAALFAIEGKYGRRQAGLERQYQARQRVAAGETGEGAANVERRTYATPDSPLVPLWPLALIMVVVVVLAGAMLYRSRVQPGLRIDESSPR